MAEQITVAVADDDPSVRASYRRLIESQPDMRVVAEAGDGIEAYHAAFGAGPDLVIMDLHMPRMDGIEATRRICSRPSHPAVLILTVLDHPEDVAAGLLAGASGFIVKNGPVGDLLRAIRAVHGGEAMLSPAVTRGLIDSVRTAGSEVRSISDDLGRAVELTDRESQLLRLIALGRSNDEIAGELFLAPSSVKTYVSRLRAKLNARTRAELVALYYSTEPTPPPAAATRVPRFADRMRRPR